MLAWLLSVTVTGVSSAHPSCDAWQEIARCVPGSLGNAMVTKYLLQAHASRMRHAKTTPPSQLKRKKVNSMPLVRHNATVARARVSPIANQCWHLASQWPFPRAVGSRRPLCRCTTGTSGPVALGPRRLGTRHARSLLPR
jgi:hypothetical protein